MTYSEHGSTQDSFEAMVASVSRLELDPAHIAPNEARTGAAQGRVIVVAYASYVCPYGRRVDDALRVAIRAVGDVSLVTRYYVPQRGRDRALRAAELVEAARHQGAQRDAHTWMLQNAPLARTVSTLDLCQALSLDLPRLERALASGSPRMRVAYDTWTARARDITSAPAVIIEGEEYTGLWEEQAFIEALTERLVSGQTRRPEAPRQVPALQRGARLN